MTKNLTIKEFTEHLQKEVSAEIDYAMTGQLVKFLVIIGAAKEVGKKSADGGRGKPSIIYEIENEAEIVFFEDSLAEKSSEVVGNQANTPEILVEAKSENAPVKVVS